MSTLNTSIACIEFPRSSQFFDSVNAVRNLYYMSLFSGAQAYRGLPEPWAYWLRVGSDQSVREPLRIAKVEDRLRITPNSNLRKIEVECISGNRAALEATRAVLDALNLVKPQLRQLPVAERCAAMLKDDAIGRLLLGPLRASAAPPVLRQEEMDLVLKIAEDILISLTHPNQRSIESALS